MTMAIQKTGSCRLALACLLMLLISVPLISEAWALQINGLQMPHSFIADPAGDVYFISNINGEPEARDSNGFITKLDKAGAVTGLSFIRGGQNGVILHAPKGLAVVGRTLYVADLEAVRAFDTTTGRTVTTVTVSTSPTPDLASLVADAQGMLYASETNSNTIYRIDPSRNYAVSVLVQHAQLAGPRGLAIHPKTGNLIVASWAKGKLLEVTPQGIVSELYSNSFFSSRFNNLDGIDFDSWNNLYIADYTAGKVWRMRPSKRFDVIAEFLPSPANLSVDRKNHLILVPFQQVNAAEMNGLESPIKSTKPRDMSDYGRDWVPRSK